jgi:predicted enzyme related to lactoylglutathione lyase
MNPVTHFEMAGEDMERMKKFYETVFAWKTIQTGPEMGNYVMVNTDETDAQGMLKKTNRINGGFYKKMDDPAMNTPSVVIAVENLEKAIERVKAAGGNLLTEIMPIPGIGRYVSIKDTEGNRVGVLQPSHSMN